MFCLAELPPSTPLFNDKLMHFVAFAILGVGAFLSWPRQPFFPRIALALAAYGATIEVVQFFLPWRSAEWLDLAADVAGVVVCGLMLTLISRAVSRSNA